MSLILCLCCYACPAMTILLWPSVTVLLLLSPYGQLRLCCSECPAWTAATMLLCLSLEASHKLLLPKPCDVDYKLCTATQAALPQLQCVMLVLLCLCLCHALVSQSVCLSLCLSCLCHVCVCVHHACVRHACVTSVHVELRVVVSGSR